MISLGLCDKMITAIIMTVMVGVPLPLSVFLISIKYQEQDVWVVVIMVSCC